MAQLFTYEGLTSGPARSTLAFPSVLRPSPSMNDTPIFPPSEFTDTTGAAEFTGFTVKALEDMRTRRRNAGPRYYRVGRHIRYTYADLTAWLTANPVEPSSPQNDPDLAQGSDAGEVAKDRP